MPALLHSTRKSQMSWASVPEAMQHCIESNLFRLAGLDAVRLVLYPNGMDDVPMQAAIYLKSCAEDNRYVARVIIAMNSVSRVFQGDVRHSLGKRKFCQLNGVEKLKISVEVVEVRKHRLKKKESRLETVQ